MEDFFGGYGTLCCFDFIFCFVFVLFVFLLVQVIFVSYLLFLPLKRLPLASGNLRNAFKVSLLFYPDSGVLSSGAFQSFHLVIICLYVSICLSELIISCASKLLKPLKHLGNLCYSLIIISVQKKKWDKRNYWVALLFLFILENRDSLQQGCDKNVFFKILKIKRLLTLLWSIPLIWHKGKM